MRVKVVSGGPVRGTRVLNAETGEDFSHLIDRVSFVHEADDISRIEMRIILHETEVEGDGAFYAISPIDKAIKRVKRIEFEDGSVFEPK